MEENFLEGPEVSQKLLLQGNLNAEGILFAGPLFNNWELWRSPACSHLNWGNILMCSLSWKKKIFWRNQYKDHTFSSKGQQEQVLVYLLVTKNKNRIRLHVGVASWAYLPLGLEWKILEPITTKLWVSDRLKECGVLFITDR